MLRVAQQAPSLRLAVSGREVRSVSVGRLTVPTEADGAVRVYFSPHLAQRFVSAVDVLDGQVRESELRGQLVLIGLTGVALQEYQNTPIGQRMSGSEIQAQLMENLLDGTLLQRPRWAPLLRSRRCCCCWARCCCGPCRAGAPTTRRCCCWLAWRCRCCWPGAPSAGTSCCSTPLTPSLCLLLFFGVLLLLTLAESTQQGRALQRLVQAQREDGARLAGELQAAQQVQTANLPQPRHAAWRPARRAVHHACSRRARSAATCTTSSCSTSAGCSC